jgi:hypothetical protein
MLVFTHPSNFFRIWIKPNGVCYRLACVARKLSWKNRIPIHLAVPPMPSEAFRLL